MKDNIKHKFHDQVIRDATLQKNQELEEQEDMAN